MAVYNSCVTARIKSGKAMAATAPFRTMLKHAMFAIALLSTVLVNGAAGQSAAPDHTPAIAPASTGLIDRVIANQKKGEAAFEVYERIERVEIRKNPNDVNPSSVKIARVIPSGTGMDRIPVGPDGKPTDAVAYRAELESLERALARLVNDSRSQRDAVEKYAKKRKDRSDLIEATRDAFLFTFVADEPRGERVLSKYKMVPNPAFRPTSRFTSIFPKVHGFVWVDEGGGELARIEGEVTEDISVALFLGKIYKGSHFMQERYEFPPGLWLPSFSQYDFDGRKLFSSFSIHERTFYSDYRYIGPPKEALEGIRRELGHGDLGNAGAGASDP